MQRLLQGDVGSGKTVVALYSLLRAVESGRQGALMAPTEVLAEQHFLTIEGLCAELGIRVALLTSALGARERGNVRQLIASGDVELAVGTHALIQQEVEFPRSRRCRRRRATPLRRRAAVGPRRETGTARAAHDCDPDPSHPRPDRLRRPRRLRDHEPPAHRKPIVTAWVTEDRSSEAYERLKRHLTAGRQAYVVCPLIEASETTVARAAEDEAERLRRAELKGFRVGCLHGRVKPAERRALMAAIKAGELDVLVATTVIEVGVDIPNATIMIIQEADRFGLAQLHQLRGRVGRGAEQSYCLLVSRRREELTDIARDRLEAMVATSDGFEIAERDLEIRGEGQLLGARQSGLSDLRFTKLRQDRILLERARDARDRARGSLARRAPPCSSTPWTRCSMRPTTSASREDHLRRAARGAHLGPAGRAHPADERPRARGGVQPDRACRRRGRARPVRGLRRDGARGALPRCPALPVRRLRPRLPAR